MSPLQAPGSQVGAGAAVPTISASLQQLGIHPAVPDLHSGTPHCPAPRAAPHGPSKQLELHSSRSDWRRQSSCGVGCPGSSRMEGFVQSTGSFLPPTARSAFTDELCSTLLSWTQPPCCAYSLGGFNPCGTEVWLLRSVCPAPLMQLPGVWHQEIWAVPLRGNRICPQLMLLCCWVREAASPKGSVPALTQQRFGHPCNPRFGCSFS